MFSFFKKPTQSYAVFLSLTSSGATGALVETSSTIPSVIETYTEYIPVRKEMDTTTIAKNIETSAERVLSKLTKGRPEIKYINSIHCVLSSPWVVTQTKTVISNFDQPKEINRNNILQIIDHEKDGIQNSYSDIKFIEEKICLTKVNGYEVESINKVVAKSLEVSFIVSTTATSISDALQNAAHATLPKVAIEYHSAILLEYSTLSRLYPDIKDCVFIDIHGEVTDVVALGGGVPRYTGSFPLGTREFIQTVARRLKVSHGIADSKLTLHAEESHDPLTSSKIQEAVTKTGDAWINHITESMREIGDTMIVPCKIMISADKYQSAFVTLVEKECKEGRLSNFCDIIEYSHDIFGRQISFVPATREDGRLAAYILGVRDLI
ncbi:MAG: hypothetical protein HZA80_02755 [Candidatus Taylorbacteria bacterium]|nr:hypothetical protein [Candidatus Taylorbacteria bacterium]